MNDNILKLGIIGVSFISWVRVAIQRNSTDL